MISDTKSDEGFIDVGEYLAVVWLNKWKVITLTLIFCITSILYSLTLSNVYKATVILKPAKDDASQSVRGLASQFGGLASLAGINIGGSSDKDIEYAIQLMKSWYFIEEFLTIRELKKEVFASKSWDAQKGLIIYDPEIINLETNEWILEPSSKNIFDVFSEKLKVVKDKDTGLLEVSFEHFSPQFAVDILYFLIEDINNHFREVDREEAERSILMLEQKIEETNVAAMENMFYNLIENHEKTLILSSVNEQYVLKVLIPPMEPENKSSPKRALLVIMCTLLGFFLTVFSIIIRHHKIN